MIKILIRAAALTAILFGQLYAWKLVDGDEAGANIGAGLIAFGVTVLISVLWAGYDASRRPTSLVVRIWAGAAVAFALASSFLPQINESTFDWGVWRSDLVFVGGLGFFLVFGPAMISALVVGAGQTNNSQGT